MDAEIHRLWCAGLSPFNGITIHLVKHVPLAVLRESLAGVVDVLEQRYSGSTLRKLDDWFEHDGFISESAPSSWAEVRSWLVSDEALYASRTRETYVRVAVYPEECSWYLRVYVPDEEDHLLRAAEPHAPPSLPAT